MSRTSETAMSDSEAAHRPKLNLPAKLAAYLTTLHARPDGVVEVAAFVAAFRDSVPAKQRYLVTRGAIVEALGSLGVLIGTAQNRQCIIGFSSAPPAPLTVNEARK